MNNSPSAPDLSYPTADLEAASSLKPLASISRDLAALALIAALVLLFFWRIITPQVQDRAVFPPGDFTDQFWAFRMYEARALAAGRLPLWSENYNSGHPFLADVQSAIFYPVGLAFTLGVVALHGADFTLFDLQVEAIFHLILAGAFTYLLARRLIRSRLAALVSAVTFTFGGYLTSYPPQQLAILETATWLPLALLFLDLAVAAAERGVAYYVAAGLVLGIAALAGHPQTFLFVVYASALFFFWRAWQGASSKFHPGKYASLDPAGPSTASRSFDYASQNQRGSAQVADLAIPQTPRDPRSRDPTRDLGGASSEDAFGTLLRTRGAGVAGSPLRSEVSGSKFYALRFASYVSPFAFYGLRFALSLLIAAGIAAVQWIPTLEYQSVSTRAVLTWAEAARGFPTLDPLQMILPGFASAFQSPLYIGILPLWLALFALAVGRSRAKVFWALLAVGSLLVAFGFYVFAYALLYLLAPGFGMFRDQERLAFIVSFALAMLAGYGFRDLFAPALDKIRARRVWALLPAGLTVSALMLFAFYIGGAQHSSGRLAFLLDRSGLMVLLFALAGALVAAHLAGRISPRGLAIFAIALITFDLFSVDGAAYNAAPTPRYPDTPIVQAIRSDHGLFRVADEGQLPGHFGIAYGLEEIGGISPLRVGRYDTLLDLPPETLWPLLNVRYVVTGRSGFANAEVVARDGNTNLIRLKDTLPRAWVAGSAEENVGDAVALEVMQSDSFKPQSIAYVAGPLPFPVVPNAASNPVTVERRDPEHLALSVQTPTDSLVMLSEVYYPGWTATVDGVPTPILRADYALRAVAVRAGTHRIEMTYDPWSVKIGMGVTAATLLAIALGGIAVRMRARRI